MDASKDASNPSGNPANPHWWLYKADVQARSLFALVNRLLNDDRGRNERNLRCLRLYGNSDAGFGPNSSRSNGTSTLPENRVKINIVSSMAETISSKISKMRPKITFLTAGGDWASQKTSQKLSKFVSGLFYRNNIHSLHQDAFKDSTILDIGALKHYIRGKEIITERVLANELVVDPIDAMYGKPQSMYQVKYVHKDVLIALFPSKAGIIQAANWGLSDLRTAYDDMENYVAVIEAWHLPSGDNAKDGRHVIALENGILAAEVYERKYFPFTFMRWSSRIVGWFGQSLAERLSGTQLEINKMLRTIQQSFNLGSAFKVFLEQGSRVAKEQLNNEIGSIVYYSGAKPEFYVPQTVHPEYFQHLNFLIQSAYEEAGISQLSSSSKLPSGLDGGSGKALREYNSIETDRFAITSQNYESSFLETARQYIDLTKELHDEGTDLAVTADSKKFMDTIKWSEIDLDHDDFIMQMFPTSNLPSTPAGKLQYVQELINSGYVQKEFATKLLDFPDTDAYAQYANAALDDILDSIEDCMDDKYSSPEPYQDLALGLKIYQSAYLQYRHMKGVSESQLENLRTWMSTAEAMMNEASAAAQAQQQQAAPPTADQVAQEQIASEQGQPAGMPPA